MPKPKQLLSFAQVLALPAGTREAPSWVGDFYATVSNVRPGNGWTEFTLSDGGQTIAGSAQDRDMSAYEGRQCQFSGSMSKGEYKGVQKISVFRKCVIMDVGKTGFDRPGEAPVGIARPAPAPNPPRSATEAPSGGPVNGQTVGMAMKEAIGLHAGVLGASDLANCLQDPVWWAKIESTASRIIAISRGLEQGKPGRPAASARLSPPADSHPDFEGVQLDQHGNPF